MGQFPKHIWYRQLGPVKPMRVDETPLEAHGNGSKLVESQPIAFFPFRFALEVD